MSTLPTIFIKNNLLIVTSLQIAESFNKAHRNVLRDIKNIECSSEFKESNFVASSYKNTRGKVIPIFNVTRDGFSILAMGYTGKEAMAFKEAFIKAFNHMENALNLQNHTKDASLLWKRARIQSKAIRRSLTDIIKDFIEYAESQGSEHAEYYYKHITRMEYAALELVQYYDPIKKGLRDKLDGMDLCFLMTSEQIARNALEEDMKQEMHYKDIFVLAKSKVIEYADTINLIRLQ